MGEKKVKVKVVEIIGNGKCPLGLKVGDSFLIEGAEMPAGFCSWAFNSIFPFLTVLRFGGRLPWEKEEEARVCCPDPHNPVVFELHTF